MGMLMDSACTGSAGGRSELLPCSLLGSRSSNPPWAGGCCGQQEPSLAPKQPACWERAGQELVPCTQLKSQQPRGQADTVGDVLRAAVTLSSPEEGHGDQETPGRSIPTHLCLYPPATSPVQLHREDLGATWQALSWTGLTAATAFQTSSLQHPLLLPGWICFCNRTSWLQGPF